MKKVGRTTTTKKTSNKKTIKKTENMVEEE